MYNVHALIMGVILNDLEHGWQFATQSIFYEDGQKNGKNHSFTDYVNNMQ